MSKRNQKIVMSKEAKLLKKLRIDAELSLRKLAGMLNLSFTRVHQMESGREDITGEYIEQFLSVLELRLCDWHSIIGGEKVIKNDLRQNCHDVLDNIESNKLELIYEILSNF